MGRRTAAPWSVTSLRVNCTRIAIWRSTRRRPPPHSGVELDRYVILANADDFGVVIGDESSEFFDRQVSGDGRYTSISR